MLKQALALSVAIALTGCNSSNEQVDSKVAVQNKTQVSYPDTRKDNVVDTYFGQQVADPYRWLEDDMSAETAEWVKAPWQNPTKKDCTKEGELVTGWQSGWHSVCQLSLRLSL